MTSKEWILNNLNVVEEKGQKLIDWGDGCYTSVDSFNFMFGNVIENALSDTKDVYQEIADNDNNRGFKQRILNQK